MKKYMFSFVMILMTVSCSNNNNEQANQYLGNIQSLSENGQFEEALLKIDSIQILFPQAFDEIKQGLVYKQEVRKAMNKKQIADCDSLIAINSPKIDSLKKLFILSLNKEYQEKGTYIPKSFNSNTLTSTILRSGVNEDGTMYIESVYLGKQLHNAIRVNSKDKQSAESLPVTDDGLNFRFSNLGKQYEVIKVTPAHDNGLAKFIYSAPEQPLTVVLKGKQSTSFPLTNIQKKAIKDSYLLSTLLIEQDSLLTAKDKAQILIKYIDSKESKNDSINVANSKN